MNETIAYLDSSAIVKRYLAEEGSPAVDELYHRAEAGQLRLAFSVWNIGEVLRAMARAVGHGWITESEARTTTWSFLRETLKIRGLGGLRLVPVRGDLLAASVPLLFRRGLSQPDALQIATCRDLQAKAFVCADAKLRDAAHAEGLTALHPVDDAARLRAL